MTDPKPQTKSAAPAPAQPTFLLAPDGRRVPEQGDVYRGTYRPLMGGVIPYLSQAVSEVGYPVTPCDCWRLVALAPGPEPSAAWIDSLTEESMLATELSKLTARRDGYWSLCLKVNKSGHIYFTEGKVESGELRDAKLAAERALYSLLLAALAGLAGAGKEAPPT